MEISKSRSVLVNRSRMWDPHIWILNNDFWVWLGHQKRDNPYVKWKELFWSLENHFLGVRLTHDKQVRWQKKLPLGRWEFLLCEGDTNCDHTWRVWESAKESLSIRMRSSPSRVQGVMSSPGREKSKCEIRATNRPESWRTAVTLLWGKRDWSGVGQRGPAGRHLAFLLQGKWLEDPARKGPLGENWESYSLTPALLSKGILTGSGLASLVVSLSLCC